MQSIERPESDEPSPLAYAIGYSTLQARSFRWLIAPVAVWFAASVPAGILGGLAYFVGITGLPVVMSATALFAAVCIVGAMALCPRHEWSVTKLLAAYLSVGNVMLMAGAAAAWFLPPVRAALVAAMSAIPAVPAMVTQETTLLLGFSFLLGFALFTITAPFSLILLRYIAFVKG